MKLTRKELQIGQKFITKIDKNKIRPDIYNSNKPMYPLLYCGSISYYLPENTIFTYIGDYSESNVHIKMQLDQDVQLVDRYNNPINIIRKKGFIIGEYWCDIQKNVNVMVK
jgi:hypothetical protein